MLVIAGPLGVGGIAGYATPKFVPSMASTRIAVELAGADLGGPPRRGGPAGP
jgi:hypothetical protein